MKQFLSLVLAAALCAPAFAQKGGSLNRNAPEIKQSITVGGTSMSLDYSSVAFGEGKTFNAIMDKANADRRKQMNEAAPKMAIGKFKTSADVKVGDATVATGEYDVYFTFNDDASVNINFKSGEKVVTSKLALTPDSGHESKMLLMCLYAADKSSAGVYLAFGKMSGMLAIAPAAAPAK